MSKREIRAKRLVAAVLLAISVQMWSAPPLWAAEASVQTETSAAGEAKETKDAKDAKAADSETGGEADAGEEETVVVPVIGYSTRSAAGSDYGVMPLADMAVDGALTGVTGINDAKFYADTHDLLLGYDAKSQGTGPVALGSDANAGGQYGTAIGASESATGEDSSALGMYARAGFKDSVAIGSGSIAAADNSVALGTGSVADEENTISVGSSTNQRRITNVAAGKNATDAVNVAQLKSSEAGGVRYDTKADGSIDYSNITLGGGNGGTTRISNVSAGVNNNDAVNYAQLKQSVQETKQYTDQRMVEMDNKLSKTESKLSGGIASAMAMTGLPQAYTPGASMASIGGGTYNGESAVALGVSMVSANGRWVYKLQGSTNSQGEYSAALGAGIQW